MDVLQNGPVPAINVNDRTRILIQGISRKIQTELQEVAQTLVAQHTAALRKELEKIADAVVTDIALELVSDPANRGLYSLNIKLPGTSEGPDTTIIFKPDDSMK